MDTSVQNKWKFCSIKRLYIAVYRSTKYIFLEYDYAKGRYKFYETVEDIYTLSSKQGVARAFYGV